MMAEYTHTREENDFPKIPRPTLRALNGAGYFSVKPLTQARKTELSKLHKTGPKVLRTLEQALAAKDRSFKG